jgi:hypothetical protein
MLERTLYLKYIAFIVFRELCPILSGLKYLVLDQRLKIHTWSRLLHYHRIFFSKILDFSNNMPVLITSDNFASKNASIKVATLKMWKILTENKFVVLYPILPEIVKYQWL